jgi:hypothetical protein
VTSAAPASLRTVSFGDLQSAVWGAMHAGEPAFLAVGAISPGGEASPLSDFAVEGSGPTEPWTITAAGIELTITPDGELVDTDESGGFVQLCRVSGSATIGGEQREFECEGIRGARDAHALPEFESLREVAAWFERDEGITTLALRPLKAKGHGTDAVFASVIEPEGPMPVAEARLSTTYAGSGVPTRMGLELWVGDEEAEQYPRRVAGEAAAQPVATHVDGLEVVAAPLRCHSRGRDGAGVYLLARRG